MCAASLPARLRLPNARATIQRPSRAGRLDAGPGFTRGGECRGLGAGAARGASPPRAAAAREGREAPSRRAAEHRAARGEGQGPGRPPDPRPHPAARGARRVPALRRQRPRAARTPIARWPRTCTRGSSSPRPRSGCSTTSTSSPPRSATCARTSRAATTASCPSSPRASSRATPGSTRWPWSSIRHSDSRLDRQQLVRFLNSFQTVAPLTIGELWAWPSMLKLALIENLRRLAEEVIDGARGAPGGRRLRRADRRRRPRPAAAAAGRDPPGVRGAAAAARPRVRSPPLRGARRRGRRTSLAQQTASEDAIRSEHQRQAAAQVSVANVDHEPAPVRRPSTGASTSSRSAWSSGCCSATRRASTAAWTS